jgi:predicted nucleic acid-binding protein
MKVLMDTSSFVAVVLPWHAQHATCVAWLEAAKQRAIELVISVHTIAELYAVLTRMPSRPRITGDTAVQFIADILTAARPVSLSARDYQDLIALLAQSGLIGGVIYDGVIAKAAANEGVDYLLTLNKPDFERVWPAGAARIVSPDTLPPPQLATDQEQPTTDN